VRVVGEPGAFEVPHVVDVDSLLGRAGEAGVARLAVIPERAQALRARGRVVGATGSGAGGRDLVEVAFSSLWAFADEVVGYADAVVVMEPASLRAIVVERLMRAGAWGVNHG
jgi:proteasome accessory factor B